MRYIKKFKKAVFGFAFVEAKSLQVAKEMFEIGDYDEHDNHSEYEWEELEADK